MGKFLVLTSIAASAMLAGASEAEAARKPAPPVAIVHPTGPETIAFTQRKPPTLRSGAEVNVVPGSGLGGILGAVIGEAIVERMSGASLAKKSQIVDPAPELSRELASILAERREAIAIQQPIVIERQKPKAIAKAAAGARYIVDVRTMGWGVVGSSLDERDAGYTAKLDVIDGRTGEVAVRADCRWEAPALLTNDRGLFRPDAGDLAKAHFGTAHEVCLSQFRIAIRSLYLSSTRPADDRGTKSFRPEETIALTTPIEARVAPHAAVAITTLPPPPPVTAAVVPADSVRNSPMVTRRIQPAPVAPVAHVEVEVEVERREPRRAAPLPPYVEYPYARPNEAPPSRTPPPPEVRYAGRDANGFLTWPGKRP